MKTEAMERELLAVDSGMPVNQALSLLLEIIERFIFYQHSDKLTSYIVKCVLLTRSKFVEFNQAIQNDACRLQQLQCHTSTKGHPLNRFAWGKDMTSRCTFVATLQLFMKQVKVNLFFVCAVR